MSPRHDIDGAALWIARALMLSSGVALALGLLLYIAGPASPAPTIALRLGLLLLMSIPLMRVAAVIVDRLWFRDYQMVLLTAIVLLELAVVLVLAFERV